MKEEGYYYLVVKKCSMCGRSFVPAPYHVYRDAERHKLFCSYTCHSKYLREYESRLKRHRVILRGRSEKK